MKKRSLFILLFVMCIGVFIPKNTFALPIYNNVNIDYRFFVDEDDSDAGNLKFKLYDKSGTLNFNSQYDSNTKQYYFEYNENGFYKETNYNSYYDYYSYWWIAYDWNSDENDFRGYVPYVDELYQVNNYGNYHVPGETEFNSFLQQHQLIGFYDYSNGGSTLTFYTYVPLVLENIDTGIKKICFASINVRGGWDGGNYVHLFFVNNTVKWKEEGTTLGDSFLDNVNFMRKTMLDYSDELWESLNNGPIASSEVYSDIISSGKYVNRSLSNGNYNVPEETLDDYADSFPVFSLKKTDSIVNESNKDENENIIDVISNPKTWNNGIILLIVSMIVIVGSGYILIKRNKKI